MLSTEKVRGTSSRDLRMSRMSLEGTATSLTSSEAGASTSILRTSVVSRSVARTVSVPCSWWNRKQLTMGTVLLFDITPLID